MESTYVEIHLINQKTQEDTVVQLGDPVEQGQAEWVLDQTGVDYSRFRFIDSAGGIRLEYLEGDSTVLVDGAPVTSAQVIRDGALLQIDDETFRCQLRRQHFESTQPSIDAGWMTITGSVRPHNEDAIGIFQQPPYYLFAVADGVGGAEAGEIISEFAIKYLLHTFSQFMGPQTDWASVFHTAVVAINEEARRYAQYLSVQGGKRVQAGCTLTAIALNGWEAQGVHVGDSRLYLQQDGVFKQFTTDHSTFPTENMDPRQTFTGGNINATKRNVLIKGVGKSDTIEPDLKRLRLKPGDKLLMCSDGMSDRVGEPELAGLIEGMPPQKLAAHLAKTADERRSGDNVSVIVVRIGTPHQVASGAQSMPQPRAFIGAQPRPRLSTVPEVTTENSTDTGDSRLSLKVIIPVVIVVLIIIIVILLLARGAG
ncbi:MAG: protein phosphatase 2C domain-containing protein [Anaerolineae bacterium]|nr:protein phosphatase 2C domain-containing protein [Anaerolineae bacterium]